MSSAPPIAIGGAFVLKSSLLARRAAAGVLVGVLSRSALHVARVNAHAPEASTLSGAFWVALGVVLLLVFLSSRISTRLRLFALTLLFVFIGALRFEAALPKPSVFCRLSRPTPPPFEPFTGPYRSIFTSERFAVLGKCRTDRVVVLQGPTVWGRLWSVPQRLRGLLLASVRRSLAEPAATVLGSVVFGVGENIPRDIIEIFRRTGTLHILVVSGQHFSLLAAGLFSVLGFLGLRRPTRSVGVGAGLFFFLALIGFPASAVRGWLAALSVLLARLFERPRAAVHILLLSAAAMTLIDPWLPLFSLGFQLSVAASLGIVSFEGPIERLIGVGHGAFYPKLREAIGATLAALLATVPLLLYAFGSVSLVSLVANIAAGIFAPALLVLGLIFTAFSVTLPPVSRLIAPAVGLAFNSFVALVSAFADVPWANVVFGRIPWGVTFLYYALFIALCWLVSRDNPTLRFPQQSDRIGGNITPLPKPPS